MSEPLQNEPPHGETVALMAASGHLSVRIREWLASARGVCKVVEMDPLSKTPEDLAEAMVGVDVLLILDTAVGPDLDGTGGSVLDPDITKTVIDAARAAGVRRVIYISSAMVYGAWADSPVPITEDAPLRPIPELAYAVTKAEIERQLAAWQQDDPGVTVAVLRPVVVVDPDRARWFTRSPWGRVGSIISSSEAHRQFVHVEDLVEAIEVARTRHLDGPFNVAPDGWLAPDARRDLDGLAPNLPIPDRVASLGGRVRTWIGLSPVPTGLDAYLRYPWVVSNDRLRAAGWEPAHTNEEAFIEAVPQGRFAAVGVRRRQELSLAVLLAALVSALVAGALVIRRYGSRWSR